jgi:hypothetical protein
MFSSDVRRPEATFRMLRDIISKEDELENMRNHLEECLEMDMSDIHCSLFVEESRGIFPSHST